MALFQGIRRFCSTQSIQQQAKECVQSKSFNRVMSKINIVKASDGICVAELKLEEEHLNPMQTLHGGFSATLVDNITSFALATHKKGASKVTVSVDLHMSYFKSASLGDTIVIDAKTLRAGKTLGFLSCEIRNKDTDELLVKGSHTKFIMEPRG